MLRFLDITNKKGSGYFTALVATLIFFSNLPAQQNFEEIHSIWDKELKLYVKAGKVNYKLWSKKQQNLDKYLTSLKNISPNALKSLPRNSKMAIYINAYNAFMIKAVLKNSEIKSVQNIKPKIWNQKIVTLAGKSISLDELENSIIRPLFKDPRIHFAIVCASISCPPISDQAYTMENMEMLLETNTIAFLKNTSENYFSGNQTKLSKLFQWFKQDFDKFPGGLEGFLKKYAPAGYDPKKEITWTEYNWNLNSR